MTYYIVDDEKNSREVLKELITAFFPNYEYSGEAASVEEAYIGILKQEPAIVLLDIQMANGNGFELLKRFKSILFHVIFITSYSEYAIDAIKFNALDYLLKPIDIKLLGDALEKASLKKLVPDLYTVQIINLIDKLDESVHDVQISIHEKERVRILKLSEIVYLEGDVNYTYIYTETEKLTTSKSIKAYESCLKDNAFFIRIHRKYIINVQFLKYYEKGDPFYIVMKNNIRLEASRRKKAELIEKIKS